MRRMMENIIIKRGEIYYADLGKGYGSKQGGRRPVVIIQNDIGNKFSPMVTVVPLTSRVKRQMPTHVTIDPASCGIRNTSIVLGEQIMTINKSQLSGCKIGMCNNDIMKKVNYAIMVQMGLVIPQRVRN